MHIDWLIVIVVMLLLLALLSFVLIYNRKDRKRLEDKLNNDYRKSSESTTEEGITESEEGTLWPAKNKRR